VEATDNWDNDCSTSINERGSIYIYTHIHTPYISEKKPPPPFPSQRSAFSKIPVNNLFNFGHSHKATPHSLGTKLEKNSCLTFREMCYYIAKLFHNVDTFVIAWQHQNLHGKINLHISTQLHMLKIHLYIYTHTHTHTHTII